MSKHSQAYQNYSDLIDPLMVKSYATTCRHRNSCALVEIRPVVFDSAFSPVHAVLINRGVEIKEPMDTRSSMKNTRAIKSLTSLHH